MAIQVGQTRLVLASASPRRREMLQQLGIRFEVDPANVDETVARGEKPADYVLRIAQAKAYRVAAKDRSALVLAADTIVVLGTEILGKPRDEADAREMLKRLSGQQHVVMTAIAFDGAERLSLRVDTRVRFRALSDREIAWYVGTGEPLDKAGAYGIQGLAANFVLSVEGSYTNVVGLPLAETVGMLDLARFPLPWGNT